MSIRKTCVECARPYTVKPSRAASTCCSVLCAQAMSAKRFVAQRGSLLWARVSKGDVDACWPWTGAVDDDGYGIFTVRAAVGAPRGSSAHRAAYEVAVGPIGDGLCVCHRCDNRRCCNPKHLFLGTNEENTADRTAKGRTARIPRDKHHLAKVSTLDIRWMRWARAYAGATFEQIARPFGVTYQTAHKLCARRAA